MFQRSLVLVLLGLGAVGCRPQGEIVRYMARPPASTVKAPQDGTYLLYPGTNDPPILVEDLKAGDPIGFTIQQTAAGKRLFAVVGQDQSFNLERGERYAWMLQGRMNPKSLPGADEAGGPDKQRLNSAQRAYDAAAQQLKSAQQNFEAAQRRLEEAQKQSGGQ
ncbi:MAG: hypothetical protein IT448_02215 [Phycisphaerales bacterium]|nr:hypothetical protein [Phycisphaerales bacterium]